MEGRPGQNNRAKNIAASVTGGGYLNMASGFLSVVDGGWGNVASTSKSAILGGKTQTISSPCQAIPATTPAS